MNRFLWRVLAATSLAVLTAGAGAQAGYTGEARSDIAVFGAGSWVSTDFGANDYGLTFGGDYSRLFRRVTPSLEARYTYTSGNRVTEDSFVGGLKLGKHIRRFAPYVTLLGGYGVIHFKPGLPNYTHDNSFIYDFGLGLDYRVSSHFDAKVDVQQQFWKLGTETSGLQPYALNIGLQYHFSGGFARHPRSR